MIVLKVTTKNRSIGDDTVTTKKFVRKLSENSKFLPFGRVGLMCRH